MALGEAVDTRVAWSGENEAERRPLCSLVTSDNSTKLHKDWIQMRYRKNLFTVHVVKEWNSLPSKMVGAP